MFKLVFRQERTGEKRGTWNDVLLFGKKVTEQSWGVKIPSEGKMSWGGEYWTLRIKKSVRVRIYNPVSVLKSTLAPFNKDLKYALKTIQAVRSGYSWMESHERDEWRAIGYTASKGERLSFAFELEDDPHYVCARFGNGRHIPLPLVLGDDGDAGPLQRLALRIACKRSSAMRSAMIDCAHYYTQFQSEYPDVVGIAEIA